MDSGSNQGGDMKQFVSVDEIISSIDKYEDQRHKLATEKSNSISKNLIDWKESTDQNIREMNANIEALKRRKEELKTNSMKMKDLSTLILQKINGMPTTSNQEPMQS